VVGAMLCAIGFLSAIIVGLLDKYGLKQLGQDVRLRQDSKKLVNLTIFFSSFMHYCIYIIKQLTVNAVMHCQWIDAGD